MFHKYCSIENHYQNKHIEWFLDKYPELEEEMFIIEHKIDGSNFQFCFEPNGEWRVGSRNNLLDSNGNFQRVNLQEFFKQRDIATMIESYQDMAYNDEININVYGELFANHIQRRIKYGKDVQFRIFGSMIDGRYETPMYTKATLKTFGVEHLLVDNFGYAYGLKKALEFNADRSSDIIIDGGIIEGVVIKPYYKVYLNGNGSPFYLKKKNKSFMEKSGAKKTRTLPDNIKDKQKLFSEYVNENRVLSVFSKHGEIESNKQIGEYVKYVLEDAKEDFLKEVFLEDIDKKDEKKVFNVGSKVAHLLMKYL